MYALGWTQHTVGVQNIRSACIVQLLLGNMGIAGGGVNALRGEPNVQGSTDHALLYHILPGYNGVPIAELADRGRLQQGQHPGQQGPQERQLVAEPAQVPGQPAQGLVSATRPRKENDFCYGLLPKARPRAWITPTCTFSTACTRARYAAGSFSASIPMNSLANTNKARAAMDKLDWVVVSELHHSETTDNWRRPGCRPQNDQDRVLPAAFGPPHRKRRHDKQQRPLGALAPQGHRTRGRGQNLRLYARGADERAPRQVPQGRRDPARGRRSTWTGPRPTTPKTGPSGSTAFSWPTPRSGTRNTKRGSSYRRSAPWLQTAPPRA